MSEKDFLTINEVAGILRVNRNTVGRYVKQGLLETVSLGKGKKTAKRISRAELDRYLGEKSHEEK